MYNVHVQKTPSQSPGLQALRQDPRGVRIDDDCHGPHRERRGADRALWCGGGQGAIPIWLRKMEFAMTQWIGLRENLQENPIFI